MARIRCIRPDLWTDETFADLSDPAKLTALSLENAADDLGFFPARPELVKAASPLFDFDACGRSVSDVLAELAAVGWIRLLPGKDGRSYGLLVGFAQRQKIDRKTPSRIAPLVDASSRLDEDSPNPRRGLDEDSTGKGREGKGREGKEETPPTPSSSHPRPPAKGARERDPGLEAAGPTARPREDTFAAFWAVYPRRVKRGAAEKAWARIAPLQRPEVLDAARGFAAAWAAVPRERLAVCPYPASWLTARGWEDGPEEWARQARGVTASPSRPALVGAHPSPPPPEPPRLEGLEPASAEPWASIRALVRTRIDERSFDDWIVRLRQAPGSNGTVRLVAPTQLHADFIRESFGAVLEAAVRAATTPGEEPREVVVIAPEEYLAHARAPA